jgi:hypothetical protein
VQQIFRKNLPGEAATSNVSVELFLFSRLEECAVAHKAHPAHVVVELVVVWVLCEEGN